MIDFISNQDINKVVDEYANSLNNAIKTIKNKGFDPSEQIKDLSEYRSSERIINQWINLDKSL
jgi:uncharacterized protein (UPF0305 family)